MTTWQGVAREATVVVNLLVALLVRYPTIGSARVDTGTRLLMITFLVKDRGDEQAAIWHRQIEEMLDTFFAIEKRQPAHCEVQYESHAGLGLVHIRRDLGSISQGEIALIVEALEELLGADLCCESRERSSVRDDLIMQEEWIGYMLENLMTGDEPQSLLAFREGERVLVYNANKS